MTQKIGDVVLMDVRLPETGSECVPPIVEVEIIYPGTPYRTLKADHQDSYNHFSPGQNPDPNLQTASLSDRSLYPPDFRSTAALRFSWKKSLIDASTKPKQGLAQIQSLRRKSCQENSTQH